MAKFRDFFIYEVNFGNIATAGVSTQTIQIQADSDFEWVMATCMGYEHSASEPISNASLIPVNVTIQDTGSGRQLFSLAVPIQMFAGDGRQPFILPTPHLFASRASVQCVATSFGTSNTYDNISLALIGNKVYDVPG